MSTSVNYEAVKDSEKIVDLAVKFEDMYSARTRRRSFFKFNNNPNEMPLIGLNGVSASANPSRRTSTCDGRWLDASSFSYNNNNNTHEFYTSNGSVDSNGTAANRNGESSRRSHHRTKPMSNGNDSQSNLLDTGEVMSFGRRMSTLAPPHALIGLDELNADCDDSDDDDDNNEATKMRDLLAAPTASNATKSSDSAGASAGNDNGAAANSSSSTCDGLSTNVDTDGESGTKKSGTEPELLADDDDSETSGRRLAHSVARRLQRKPANELDMRKDEKRRKRFERIAQSQLISDYDAEQNFANIQQTFSLTNRFVDDKFTPSNACVYHSAYMRNKIDTLIKLIRSASRTSSSGQRHHHQPQSVDENSNLTAAGAAASSPSSLSSSAFLSHQQPYKIEWKRAKDLFKQAEFFTSSSSSSSSSSTHSTNEPSLKNRLGFYQLTPGLLGNSTYLSAMCGLLQKRKLFERVVPDDNTLDDAAYTGAFHFRIWLYGKWKDIVVDDYLPVFPDDELVFAHNGQAGSQAQESLWCALFEKALAKLYHSYELMHEAVFVELLCLISGGIEEDFHLKPIHDSLYRHESLPVAAATAPVISLAHDNGGDDQSTSLLSSSPPPTVVTAVAGTCDMAFDHEMFWNTIKAAKQTASVVSCRIEGNEAKLNTGLIQGVLYLLIDLAEIEVDGKRHRIVLLYNSTSGKHDSKWTGDWSERSSLFTKLNEETKAQLSAACGSRECEFWMPYESWLRHFHQCKLFNLTPFERNECVTNEDEWLRTRYIGVNGIWDCLVHEGRWVAGETAGGSGFYNKDKYWTNPQYSFNLDECDLIENDSCCAIISLIQINTRLSRLRQGLEPFEEFIKFRLFSKEYGNHTLTDLEIGSTGFYSRKFEVNNKFQLKIGSYIIIPSCNDEDVEAEFLLRIFVEAPFEALEQN